MGRFYKKAIVTALLVSALSTTAFAAPEDVYTNIADSAVIMDATDTSVFKPAAIKSLTDYDEHYRLYKYDTISIRIIGYKDAQGLDSIMIGTDGYVNLPYAGSVKDYIEKHDISQNFALEDGDILYIPKSNKIDFHKDVLPLINVYSTYRALTD